MPECDADFKHPCTTEGYSRSVEHNDSWYCKAAYSIFLKAREKVRQDNQQQLLDAISSVSGGKS